MFDAAVLGWGMAHNGMGMHSEWLPDTMHDMLAMLAWDECVCNCAYCTIVQWVCKGASAE